MKSGFSPICDCAALSLKTQLAPDVVSKTHSVPVAILDVEIAVPVRLIADVACDPHSFGPEFATQYVGIIDPNIGVPRLAVGVGQAVGPHRPGVVKLAKHDDDATAFDHTKTRRVSPKAFVMKPEIVSIEISGDNYIVHNEAGCHVPFHRCLWNHAEDFTSSFCLSPLRSVETR